MAAASCVGAGRSEGLWEASTWSTYGVVASLLVISQALAGIDIMSALDKLVGAWWGREVIECSVPGRVHAVGGRFSFVQNALEISFWVIALRIATTNCATNRKVFRDNQHQADCRSRPAVEGRLS